MMMGLSPAMTAAAFDAAQCAHLGREPFPDPPDGRLARLDQQLGAVAADVESQEVEPVSARWTIRVLSSLKARPLGASHSASRALTCSACCLGVAERDQIVGVPDQRPGSLAWSPRHRMPEVDSGPRRPPPARAARRSGARAESRRPGEFPPRSARIPCPPRTPPLSASPGSCPWPGTTRSWLSS